MQNGRDFIAPVSTRESGSGLFTSFTVDLYKQIVYIWSMIVSFANKETEKLFATGKSKKLPPEITDVEITDYH